MWERLSADRSKKEIWRLCDIYWHNIGSAHSLQELRSYQDWAIPRGTIESLASLALPFGTMATNYPAACAVGSGGHRFGC